MTDVEADGVGSGIVPRARVSLVLFCKVYRKDRVMERLQVSL